MPPLVPGWRGLLREAPVSTALCAVQVAIYAAVAARSGWSPDPAHQLAAGALERSHVWAGQPWRLLTATLLHATPVHMFFNVALGWPSYWLVERDLGPRRFLLLWLASALAGSAASLLLGDVVSVGSSGALFGMLGAVLALRRREAAGWRAWIRRPEVLVLAGATAALYPAFSAWLDVPLDHAAHLGGFVGGAVTAWLASAASPSRAASLAGGAALLAACLAAAWPRPAPTAWQLETALRTTREALRREDPEAAAVAARPLEADGWRAPGARLLRARLLEARGQWDEAEVALRAILAGEQDAAGREVARRLLFRIGYRFYTGEGAPADARRAYLAIRDACAAGDVEACRAEVQIRTGVATPRDP